MGILKEGVGLLEGVLIYCQGGEEVGNLGGGKGRSWWLGKKEVREGAGVGERQFPYIKTTTELDDGPT